MGRHEWHAESERPDRPCVRLDSDSGAGDQHIGTNRWVRLQWDIYRGVLADAGCAHSTACRGLVDTFRLLCLRLDEAAQCAGGLSHTFSETRSEAGVSRRSGFML